MLFTWLTFAAPRTEARRVACDQVLSVVNRQLRATRGRATDLTDVAKELKTTIPWVEHCMRAYGRRPLRPGREAAESREAEIEAYEEDEPEETFAEDIEEPGARELEIPPPKPRILRAKPPPTPRDLEGLRERLED